MAKMIGDPGHFQKEHAIRRRPDISLAVFFLMVVIVFALGFATARLTVYWSIIAVILVIPAYKIFSHYLKKHICRVHAETSGALGARDIVRYLKALPDSYTVINNLTFADAYGNIDHLVIGPTGIFAIDIKICIGTVTADGKGELLCNGVSIDKPNIKNFTFRAMELSDRIYALTKLDPYVQCVFVFLNTHIEARWGATGAVHCINAENITDYIIKFCPTKPILAADIPRLVSTVEALKNVE